MPRTKLCDKYSAPKRPAPDYPKALILERMDAQRVTPDDMARALGLSRSTWFMRRKQNTAEWPLGDLIKACRFLGVHPDDLRAAIRYTV